MNFIDECVIFVRAGAGGDGCVAFRREPNQPRGGPSGGDGGNGGSVLLVADPQLGTLYDLSYRREYHAPSGEAGQGRDCSGKSGQDLFIKVPVGTVVKNEHDEVIFDFQTKDSYFLAAQGGKGGFGNIHFATSTNQAPHKAEPGTEGEEKTLRLELRLLADVGLLGYPNAGKSTLISRISAARPKIANYPFTTLLPHLGVVRLPLSHKKTNRSLVVADIPGLIEGAHEGKGLGHQFLRHLERTRILIHLLEYSYDPERDPEKDFEILCQELEKYDPKLAKQPQLVALTKMDLTETKERYPILKDAFAAKGIHLYGISAATGEGLDVLMEEAFLQVKRIKETLGTSIP